MMEPPVGGLTKQYQSNKNILNEEEYIERISNIIERDFYPKIINYKRKYQNFTNDDEINQLPSLDKFLSKHISEDNASFEVLQQKSIEDHRRKYHWAYEDKLLTNHSTNQLTNESNANNQSKKLLGMQELYYMNNKVYNQDEREEFNKLLDSSHVIGDDRPAAPNTWNFTVRNSFMFPPENSSNSYDIITGNSNSLVVYNNRSLTNHTTSKTKNRNKIPDKIIQHSNTGFHDIESYSLTSPLEAPHTPTQYSDSSWDTDSVAEGGHNITRKKQYQLVQMTPSPMPGVEDSPIMTWGKLCGTPMILNNNSNEESRFKILDTPKRELIARQLDSKNTNRDKIFDSKSIPGTPLSVSSKTSSSSSKSTTRKKSLGQNLTPAGIALAKKLQRNSDTYSNPFREALSGLYR